MYSYFFIFLISFEQTRFFGIEKWRLYVQFSARELRSEPFLFIFGFGLWHAIKIMELASDVAPRGCFYVVHVTLRRLCSRPSAGHLYATRKCSKGRNLTLSWSASEASCCDSLLACFLSLGTVAWHDSPAHANKLDMTVRPCSYGEACMERQIEAL